MKHVELFEGFINEAKGQSAQKLTDSAIKQIMSDKGIRGTQWIPSALVKNWYETIVEEMEETLTISALIYGADRFFKEAINSGFAISEFKKLSSSELRDGKFSGPGRLFEIKIATPKVKEAYVYLPIHFKLGSNNDMPVYSDTVIVSQSKITNYLEQFFDAQSAGTAHQEYINTQRPDLVIKAINKGLKKI